MLVAVAGAKVVVAVAASGGFICVQMREMAIDPASLPAAGRPGAHTMQFPKDVGLHASPRARPLLAAGTAAAQAMMAHEADPARGHTDTAIGMALMASHSEWRPARPTKSTQKFLVSTEVIPAGMPNHRRPCLGSLAHHIVLQPDRGASFSSDQRFR
eukprot:gnl/TRDRNA2_/TRDRNA2_187079_c0_seq1.p1 gnl/TRDRNA2_/TRDRNA2_187079_c0~~gnl/TRDRNA2_/TRDRNA2_187079_c0_seq1.p1  ORF type:complete len:167 (+),score=13.26 gnl/TRDRNA2_/TRDRNA2_187079_c0_seq1:33-503(+)